jgi:hypothetical protein
VLDKLDEEEIAKMDADEIMARQMEELEREKKELQVRTKTFKTQVALQSWLRKKKCDRIKNKNERKK